MPEPTERQLRQDTEFMCKAIREHGRYAIGRLRVQLDWAREDVAASEGTRAAMKKARCERLERVIARLLAGEVVH